MHLKYWLQEYYVIQFLKRRQLLTYENVKRKEQMNEKVHRRY